MKDLEREHYISCDMQPRDRRLMYRLRLVHHTGAFWIQTAKEGSPPLRLVARDLSNGIQRVAPPWASVGSDDGPCAVHSMRLAGAPSHLPIRPLWTERTAPGAILSFLASGRMLAIELPIWRIAAMTITLKPETERLINEELKSGYYRDAEEVIQRALQTLHATHQAAPGKVQECQEAAARIRELRKGVTLGGLKIKDLIHEGRKY